MSSKRANKAVIRGQLKGAALSVMEALDAGLTEGMPMGQLRDAAESLRALAEVLGQMESAEKLAETAETLKKQTAALGKAVKAAPAAENEEARPGIIEIARVLEEADADG